MMNFSRNRLKNKNIFNHRSNSTQTHPSKLDQLIRLGPVLFDPIRIPRYPIVLCHGLYGFSVRGPTSFPRFQIHYWGRLLEILRNKLGIKVIIGHVPSTGSIKQRAMSLNEMLKNDQSMKNCDLNFLGHSMGGLDARYLISHLNPHLHFNPVSLTTVCTPHRGSPFMDWCRVNIGVGFQESDDQFNQPNKSIMMNSKLNLPFSLSQPLLSLNQTRSSNPSKSTNTISKTFNYLPNNLLKVLLLNLLDSPAYSNLSSDFLIHKFNPNTPNDPKVKYFSIAGKIKRKLNLIHPLWLPKMILDEYQKHHPSSQAGDEGHDGLVTIESARWGEFLGVIENTDHWEIRGSSAFGSTGGTDYQKDENERWMKKKKKKRLNEDEILDEKTKVNWLEVNKLIGTWISSNSNSNHHHQDLDAAKKLSEIKSMTEEIMEKDFSLRSKDHRDLKVFLNEESSESSIYAFANWILKRLPNLSSSSESNQENQNQDLNVEGNRRLNDYKSTIHSHFPLDDLDLLPLHHHHHHRDLNSIHHHHHQLNSSTRTKLDLRSLDEMNKFDLEMVYIAICRNLYNHGF
ncbi:triacylglycerol lipase [Melampsora larici-populina 98AG31]|uniref:Triacylglycerol lipase n=1 Tax=Melampsora larici-populina (strain 98AG31 / pathotype 3-4-7) TaxID=747676 RepID=F4RNL4_MELLP|nr:triacylglycerol lipase [Melampsora larici-populina 98AG31]EGG06072.1 triacylglycerol lipase [Melampsora larici-populina 98AG31]